jgi:hypothetical protein
LWGQHEKTRRLRDGYAIVKAVSVQSEVDFQGYIADDVKAEVVSGGSAATKT